MTLHIFMMRLMTIKMPLNRQFSKCPKSCQKMAKKTYLWIHKEFMRVQMKARISMMIRIASLMIMTFKVLCFHKSKGVSST